MRILHLSDTHVRRETGADARGVDARESLRRILHDCAEIPGLDALVLTGDVADDGSREAYADVRDLLAAFTREQGIPAYVTTGNHDERHAFTQVLGTGHADRPITHLESADGERAAVSTVRGVRIVTLDSLVPGKGYGLLSRTQLDWLRAVLAGPAPHGTVVAFHHPPIHVPGVAVQRALGLQNPAELAEAIAGSDVRLLLCGHFHLQLTGALGGVPVWVTPGVVNRIDLTAAHGTERTVRGASASVVDLPEDGPPVMHTVHAHDPRAGATLHHADAVEVSEIIAKLGPEP
ncbi:metallophosphoesterase [Paractinoplanes rishiriensis]|uniref:Phosphohydrolase n=1 Tax=Paractinoplanes rishiriensis TaxID=1050105 RepID=A0A919N0H9_9ACTN|nr:metallophosphoesterase [Actinoplanes rishiriensis]GIE95122.1 phosphohydrolase [Actinoplanes rishiriensis]